MRKRLDPGQLESDVLAAASGSHEAFARLVEATQNMVTAIALAIVGDGSASHDVAQETYLTVWQKLSTLANPRSFLPWLRVITRNRARNWLARHRRHADRQRPSEELHLVEDTGVSPPEHLEQQEQQAWVRTLLSQLPDDAREVLILYYREGRSTRQVAELLEISEDAVRQRLHRARKQLRREWEARLGELERRSRPTSAFAVGVVALVTATTPAVGHTATAHLLAKTAGIASLWKTVALFFTSTVIPAILGTAAVVWGMRVELRRASSEAERQGLRRIRLWAILLVVLTALGITAGAVWQIRGLIVAAYVWLLAGLGWLYLVRLPRVNASRLADERAADPTAAARHRREHAVRWLGFVAGALGGGFGLWLGLKLAGS